MSKDRQEGAAGMLLLCATILLVAAVQGCVESKTLSEDEKDDDQYCAWNTKGLETCSWFTVAQVEGRDAMERVMETLRKGKIDTSVEGVHRYEVVVIGPQTNAATLLLSQMDTGNRDDITLYQTHISQERRWFHKDGPVWRKVFWNVSIREAIELAEHRKHKVLAKVLEHIVTNGRSNGNDTIESVKVRQSESFTTVGHYTTAYRYEIAMTNSVHAKWRTVVDYYAFKSRSGKISVSFQGGNGQR